MATKQKQCKPGFYCRELNKSDWTVPERYQDLSVIGAGAFGQVCSAKDTLNNTSVAIKKLSRPFQSKIHAERAYREVRILEHLRHDNVIGLLDVFTPAVSMSDFEEVYFVSELMSCDLTGLIKNQHYRMKNNNQMKLTEDHAKFYIYQVLRGLKFVHSAGIIHRDLKPSNVAITSENELKILDFGLARRSDEMMSGYVTTRWYRAPEIMLSWMEYNQQVDIWSVGCILAEILTGRTLFPGKDYLDQLDLILKLTGKPTQELLDKLTSREAKKYIATMNPMPRQDFKVVFKGLDPEAIDLIERMLELDPDKRITAEQALAHPYMKTFADPEDEPVCSDAYNDTAGAGTNLDIPDWQQLLFEAINKFAPPSMDD